MKLESIMYNVHHVLFFIQKLLTLAYLAGLTPGFSEVGFQVCNYPWVKVWGTQSARVLRPKWQTSHHVSMSVSNLLIPDWEMGLYTCMMSLDGGLNTWTSVRQNLFWSLWTKWQWLPMALINGSCVELDTVWNHKRRLMWIPRALSPSIWDR